MDELFSKVRPSFITSKVAQNFNAERKQSRRDVKEGGKSYDENQWKEM